MNKKLTPTAKHGNLVLRTRKTLLHYIGKTKQWSVHLNKPIYIRHLHGKLIGYRIAIDTNNGHPIVEFELRKKKGERRNDIILFMLTNYAMKKLQKMYA